ncbi:galactose oxidase, partial [bacterium]|nr:galactose oxidase [bacterium]
YGGSVSDESGFILIGGGDAEKHYADVTRILWKDGKCIQETLPPLPQPCAFHSAIKVGDAIYSIGGQAAPSSSSALHVFWRFDLRHSDRGWKALKAWPGPARILPVLASHGGDVFLFSGGELYKGDDGAAKRRYLTDAYRYNEKTGWEQLPDLPRPVTAAPSPAYVHQNQIIIFSGDNGEFADRVWELKDKHPGFNRDCVILDLDSNSWTQSGTLPFSLATTPSVIWQNSYIIPGGEDRPGHRIPTVYKLTK